jgi:putative NADH-flavin reductase
MLRIEKDPQPSHYTINSYYTYTMTTYNSVLFLGATGYIGGTVLQTILASATPPSTITAIVRNEKKAEALNSLSTPSGTTLKAVIGDLSKADQLIELAKEHDIVINCANADSEEGIKALIEGMKQRRDKTGHRPLLIQTSGTGVLVDDAQGRYPSDRVSPPLHSFT